LPEKQEFCLKSRLLQATSHKIMLFPQNSHKIMLFPQNSFKIMNFAEKAGYLPEVRNF
jgi:hypothetical protein